MFPMKSFCLFFLLLLSSGSLAAQQEVTLEDLYVKGTFREKGVPPRVWTGDGENFSLVCAKGLVNVSAATFDTTVLVAAEVLAPKGRTEPIRAEGCEWSSDGSKLVVYSNSSRVWRDNTRGDYWILNVASGELKQLGAGLEPSRMMFGKLSPDGKKFAYVYFNDIYVEDVVSGDRTRLTFDGSDSIINGTFDWVYEEELDDQDGFRWSPDGERIAFWHSDTNGTGVFYMINNVDSVYSVPIPLPYPKAGTANSSVKVGVITLSDASVKWFDVPGDPRENYLAKMDFVPGTEEVLIQQLNRLQNTNTLYYGNVRTMELRQFYQEKEETFLDVRDNENVIWIGGNKYFLWSSEKDGWRHLYRVSRDGSGESLITKGDFDVIEVAAIDEDKGYVYYAASPESAVERYLYRSRLDGKGKAERVTPEGFCGTHSYDVSPGARYAVHTYSNNFTPKVYEMVSLPDHRTVRVLEDNAALKDVYDSFGFLPREYFQVDIGEAVLDGWMTRPKNFDPSLKYPVIFYVYGEPASSTVTDVWKKGDIWNQVLAARGYIVMSVDPRGTNNPKGRYWRKSVYGRVGVIPPADHAAAVRMLEEKYPFIDSSRIGVWGWSGGGSSTAHLMFKYPEIYSVGIAVAGVYSQYLYDTIYQERYMGLPSTNPEGFHDGSPINFASGLQGDLFLIHGTGDDNVHYQSCEMLVNELVKQNKLFSMMSYPMRSHGIRERENTSYHLYQTMLKYWLGHLPAGGR